jgi:hypothetical protein
MAIPASITPATLAAILNSLGLNPKLTIAVQLTASEVTAQCVKLDPNGVLVRSNDDDIIHHIRIPVEGAPEPLPDPDESP